MPAGSYQIRLCERPGCGLRYPVIEGQPFSQRCPRCRGSTSLVLERLIPPEVVPPATRPDSLEIPSGADRQPAAYLEALLDNIRSAWNVGSMFRSADGAGLGRLHLCGITPTPENPAVCKTALGAQDNLTWQWSADGVAVARSLLERGCRLWALECEAQAEPVYTARPGDSGAPVVLVVGNEVCSVDPGIMELCEKVVCIPMHGTKRSLNAAVAFGIAAFVLTSGNNKDYR